MASQTITALGNAIINLIDRKTPIATANTVGMVKPDGSTINIDANGVISSNGGGGSGLELCDIGMALYVDETKGLRRYLNGQIVDINTNTQKFLNRLKQITTLHPSLLCTEDEWQSAKTLSAFGQVGKFVFNYSGDDIVSVRLPRVVNVQGLFDLQNLGMTVDESLPNIWYSNGGLTSDPVIDGALTAGSKWNSQQNESASSTRYIQSYSFSASTCSSTYKDNAHVQQEAIQYPYFIQIATGSETEANITNKFENTNPQTLLESKYSDKPLYNESWLLSNGQYNLKATYPTAYEGLQVEYNSEIGAGTTVTLPSGVSYTKRGLSVKLSTEEYTDYDFVLNTADEKFRLPLQVKQKFYNAVSGNYPVVGNGMTLGLYGHNQDNVFVEACLRDVNHNIVPNSLGVGVSTDYYNRNSNTNGLAGANFGVTKDPTKSGLVAKLSSTEVSGLYLYFYVGDIDQNHGIVDMGRIGEQVATKTDMLQASSAGMPSSRYINLTLGASGSTYTAPANGYIHLACHAQGGTGWFNLYAVYGVSTNIPYATSGGGMAGSIPIIKGQKFGVHYGNIGVDSFRFIYAEGSK